MRILCYGAGAVGSLVGGYLDRAGNPVALIGRSAHVDAVNRQGLEILLPGSGPQRTFPKAYYSLTQAMDDGFSPELVILTVKGYDTEAALADLQGRLSPGIPVLTLQNGVGNEELLAAALGPDRVLAGCVTGSAGLPRPGCVESYSTRGGISLAPVGHPPGPAASHFERAGFLVKVFPDYRALKWSKLLLNILGNAVPALLDLPPQEVFGNPALCGLEKAAFLEALAVMKAQSLHPVDLPGYPVRLLVLLFRTLPPAAISRLLAGRLGSGRDGKMPSLWIDLQKGRSRSEATQLNGAVVRRGRELGLTTPVNTRIMQALAAILADPSRREYYRHNAPALLGS